MNRIVTQLSEAKIVSLGDATVALHLTGAETDDAFAVLELTIAPGRLVRPHRHAREDEHCYVLEGAIGVRVNDQEIRAIAAGSWIHLPKDAMHAMWNSGPGPARVLVIVRPAGFENVVASVAASDDPERRDAILSAHGVIRSDAWTPDLCIRYNVSPLSI